MPGYSGTPLPKKLGIKDGFRVFLVNAPQEVIAELKQSLQECGEAKHGKGAIDFAMIFASSKAELCAKFKRIAKRLDTAGMLWVGWPKKGSGVVTNVTENAVRELGLAAGLVDVKVCAVSEVWSGLKFVRRLKDR